MKIKIVKANNWYVNQLGNIFYNAEAIENLKSFKVYSKNADKEDIQYIPFQDAEIID